MHEFVNPDRLNQLLNIFDQHHLTIFTFNGNASFTKLFTSQKSSHYFG